jgi:hypothetical protein
MDRDSDWGHGIGKFNGATRDAWLAGKRVLAPRISDPTILVVSCDAYADLWLPFFTIFFRQWADCPFRVCLGTNYLRYDDPRVVTLDIGEDLSWASNVALMLARIDTDHVILFLEDFLIEEPVNTRRIQRLVDIAYGERLGCLRLVAHPPLAAKPVSDAPGYPDLGVIEPGTPYRVSAQVAIWRKETLRGLLTPGADPWEFEVLASTLSSNLRAPLWGVKQTAIQYDQVVEKGRWKPKGRRMADEAGVPWDHSRPVFTEEELEAHKAASFAQEPEAQRKAALMDHFRKGDRASGLRAASVVLRCRPTSIRLWILIVAGMLGRRVFTGLEGLAFRRRLNRIKRRKRRRFLTEEGSCRRD